MKKRVYKCFLNVIKGQENWLNQMAESGYRLTKTHLFYYEFEPCQPNEYSYRVQFVADKSYAELLDYKQFLKDLGIQTFSNNINMGKLSFSEIRLRPYVKGWGLLATSPGTINKELLILEKKRTNQPFNIYTTAEDIIQHYKMIRRAYLSTALIVLIAYLYSQNAIFALFVIPITFIILYYSKLIYQTKKERN